MKPIRLTCITMILAACMIQVANTQSLDRQLIGSSGGTDQSDHIVLSWSSGEAATHTFSSGGMMLNQGFQQPHAKTEANTTIAIEEAGFRINAYPNPVANALLLKWEAATESQPLAITVYDMTGRVLINEQANPANQKEHRLNTTNLEAGSYMLRVTSGREASAYLRFVKAE